MCAALVACSPLYYDVIGLKVDKVILGHAHACCPIKTSLCFNGTWHYSIYPALHQVCICCASVLSKTVRQTSFFVTRETSLPGEMGLMPHTPSNVRSNDS